MTLKVTESENPRLFHHCLVDVLLDRITLLVTIIDAKINFGNLTRGKYSI